MKKNKLHRKSNEAIYAQAFKSGHDFVELRAEAVERDLIAPTQTAGRRKTAKFHNMSLKQVELEYLSKCKQFVASKPTVEVLSNSSGSASKATVTLDGHSLNPLQQAKDSSARIVEFSHGYKVMEGLFDTANKMSLTNKMYQFDGGTLYAYNGVLSFTNSDKGFLASEVKDLNVMASSLWKRLKDAHMRDGVSNRLSVADRINEYAAPVGMLISNEMTVNTEKLEKMDGKGIFHPHIHFTLFSDKELDESVEEDLYNLWDNITGSKYRTDKQAFVFSLAYSESSYENYQDYKYYEDNKDYDDSDNGFDIVDVLKETTKYLMDPSKWDILALNEDDTSEMYEFKIELFAEYYNSYKDIKRIKTLGLLRDSMSYINRFAQFESASVFNKSDILGELLTQLNELKYNHKKKRYVFNHVRLLTADEIIHENKSYLSNILVSKEYKNELDLFARGVIGELSNDKDKLYAEYFKSNQFKSSLEDLYNALDEAEMITGEKLYSKEKRVFSRREFEEEYDEEFSYSNYEHLIKYRDLKMKYLTSLEVRDDYLYRQVMITIDLIGKLCDICLLRKAIEKLVDTGGKKIKYSRDEIDARIFAKRLAFRHAINADPNVDKDVIFSNMFYEENGMTLPFDGRDSETINLYVEELFDVNEIFDLFRVPDDARPRLSIKLGLVKKDSKTGEVLAQEYSIGEELMEQIRDSYRFVEQQSIMMRPSRWGNPFESLPYSKIGKGEEELVSV